MFFSFSLKSSVLLIFFFHGIVFSVLLLLKGLQSVNKASLWLSIFTFLCSLYIAPFMFGYAGWYSKSPTRDLLFYVPFQQLLLMAPVLYFYFKTLLDQSFRFSKKDYIHFLPAALYLLYALVVFLTDKVILGQYYFYEDGKDKDLSTWYQIVGLASFTFYLIKSLQIYNDYKTITYNEVSFADDVMFRWAKRFLIAFLLLIAIRILFFITNPEWDEFGKKFWYYVCFSLLFYYLSISGFTNSVLSRTSFTDVIINDDATLSTQKANFLKPEISLSNKMLASEKSEIPDLERWKEQIEKLMVVDQIYKNPDLVISDLSKLLGTHSKKISQVINEGYEMNFNDFVNQHRTKALISKIEGGEHNIQTLLSLALDCGFNSKSTYNRAFKRATSLSPKAYIEKYYPK
ncbi:MAG: helix-turn-helix domain-containing protein [Saprospiraceae bacterium]